MITTLQSARLCQTLYAQNAADWDHYWAADGIICAHKVIGDDDTLTYMGSKSVLDWMRDAAAALTWWDDEIGFVPFGFWVGLNDTLAEAQQAIKKPLYVQGHSLGGVRARIAVAKMLVRDMLVERLCVFGSPKPGFANVGRIFDKCGLERVSYRNRNDPVPLTPLTVLPLLPWAHTEPWQALDQAGADDDLDPLRDHHINLYIEGVTKLPT